MQLTTRQQEVLTFLENRLRQTGLMPSTRELQQHFGFASQTAAVNHLRALERKGVIKRLAGKARAVRLTARPVRQTADGRRVVDIPVFGDIPVSGIPSDAPATQDESVTTGRVARPEGAEGCVSLDLDSIGVPNRSRTFALRMRGDSMVDAHILCGDLLILESRPARRGDVVAALINGKTTLKRLHIEDGKAFLKAENPAYPETTPVRDITIQGVMIALIRPAAAEGVAKPQAGTDTRHVVESIQVAEILPVPTNVFDASEELAQEQAA